MHMHRQNGVAKAQTSFFLMVNPKPLNPKPQNFPSILYLGHAGSCQLVAFVALVIPLQKNHHCKKLKVLDFLRVSLKGVYTGSVRVRGV